MDPLLANPNFQQMATSTGQTPEQYLASLDAVALEQHRKVLLRVSPVEASVAPVLESGPVLNNTGGGEEPGVLMRNEQNLLRDNIGERQLLETRIADLEGSVATQEGVDRLNQMKLKLIELGGSVESNQSTPQYDAAAQSYMDQLRDQQSQAAAVSPEVRAAEAELQSTTGLLSSGSLPPEMQASIQARQNAAQAALTTATTDRDARVADVTNSTLSVENPVNGNVAQSRGPVLQANPNEQPGADPAMYTPTGLTPNPSAIGAADPYAPAVAPPAPALRNGLTPNPSAVGAADPYAPPPKGPVLEDPTKPTPPAAALTDATGTTNGTTVGTGSVNGGLSATARTASGGSTGNARGSNMAYSKIGTGESLIRIGGAMYSGALQGNGLGAATQEYGSIQDANRATEAEAFKQAEATRLAELRANRVGAGKGKSGKLAGPPTAVYKEATLSAITRIKDLLGKESGFNPFDNLTGWTGSLLSAVPGTPAHDTLNSINTIEAAVGFDRLQKMRDDSPTGGALGQVTERELALLSQSLGSLKQSSSREQFVANLNSVEKHYQAAVAAVEAQQAAWYQMNGGTSPPNAAPAAQEGLTSKAAAFLE